MKRGFKSLAAALRVFARRNPEFFEGNLRKFLVVESKILSNAEFTKLFETLGERSDCYSAISPRKYKFICKADFFSDDYIGMLVQLLGFNLDGDKPKIEDKPVVVVEQPVVQKKKRTDRDCEEWLPANLPKRFTTSDAIKITGLTRGGTRDRITRWIHDGLVSRIRRGSYIKVDKNQNKPIVDNKPAKPKPNRRVGRYNGGWIRDHLKNEFTTKDVMDITGQTLRGAESLIYKWMKSGFAARAQHNGGYYPGYYIKTNPIPDIKAQEDKINIEPCSLDQFTTEQLALELKSRGYDVTLHVL